MMNIFLKVAYEFSSPMRTSREVLGMCAYFFSPNYNKKTGYRNVQVYTYKVRFSSHYGIIK
jgi:hypothetical protein